MKAYFNNLAYDFVFNEEEARKLSYSPLETDLLDGETKFTLRKKIRLHFAEPEFGDAQLDTEPENSYWDSAETMIITAKKKYLEVAMQEGNSNVRLGTIGNVYFHLGNEEDF